MNFKLSFKIKIIIYHSIKFAETERKRCLSVQNVVGGHEGVVMCRKGRGGGVFCTFGRTSETLFCNLVQGSN